MPQYQKADGSLRIVVNYTDVYGYYKRKEKIYKNVKKDSKTAKLLEAELIASTKKNDFTTQPVLFKDLVQQYVKAKEMEIRKATLERDLRTLRVHILPFFGNMKVESINPAVILEFKTYLNKATSRKNASQKLSTSYKNNILKLLRGILEYGVNIYGLPYNPARKVKSFTSRFDEDHDLHFLRLEEFNQFATVLKEKASESGNLLDWDKYVFFHLLFFCGLRKSEAYAIRWDRIKNNCVYIKSGIVQKIKGVPWEENPPKNKSSIRRIPLSKNLIQILDDHYRRWSSVYGFQKDWFVCGGFQPITDTTIENCNNETLDACGLPHIRIHDYRHSFASLLINADVNIKTIAKLMGHATVEQTWNRYGHLYPEAENVAIRVIDEMVKEAE